MSKKFYIEGYMEVPAFLTAPPDNKIHDPRFPVMLMPYPHVIWERGDDVPPHRCPACRSDQYQGVRLLIEEKSTFAASPGIFDPKKSIYTHQNYMVLVCRACGYAYHFRPEGKWYAGIPEVPEKSGVNSIKTMLGFGPKPATVTRTKVIDEKSRLFVGKKQDYQIIELHKKKRYSECRINPKITHAPVAVLTGAGFSQPLGYPVSSDFHKILPADLLRQLDTWFGSRYLMVNQLIHAGAVDTLESISKDKTPLYDCAENDSELLLDLLFRIQRIAAIIPDPEQFQDYLKNLKSNFESIFVFEEHLNLKGSYPPVTHILLDKKYQKNCETHHFARINGMVLQAVSSIIASSLHLPEDGKPLGSRYATFLNQLNTLNKSPLPVFTTNYDRSVEQVFTSRGCPDRVVTGTGKESIRSFTFNPEGFSAGKRTLPTKYPVKKVSADPFGNCSAESIAYFHMHGCASWFVEPDSGTVLEFDDREEFIDNVIGKIQNSDTTLIPAIRFQSVLNDAYAISPPFNTGYDYLLQTILHVKVFIIIGYSGRDEQILDILLWGIQHNPGIKFIIVGHGDTLPVYLQDVLPVEGVIYFSGGIINNMEKVLETTQSFL